MEAGKLLARYAMGLSAVMVILTVSACGGGGGSSAGAVAGSPAPTQPTDPVDPPQETDLDTWLRAVITEKSLTGDPAAARQIVQTTPADDPRVKLGQLLFFSHTLSGDRSVSCATCHMPDFGGSDALSLGVGVSPQDAARVGPPRRLNASTDLDPAADGRPNMHRNSQTVFNSALYDRSLSYDGRVFVLDEAVAAGGKGQTIRTPDTGNLSDASAADGLLEVFSKFPLTNHNEMRGYLYSALSEDEYRERLVARLRGEADPEMLSVEGSGNWLTLFRSAFAQPDASAQEVITLVNVQRALAAYMSSMVFVDSAWRNYVQGDDGAINEKAKQGARLFFAGKDEGGLGCASCHSGDFFTNEKFYNVGFPQIGRGFLRPEKDDIGRWNSTRLEADKYAFRVPSLLNIQVTMPYGHAGTFDQLSEVIRYHANPRQGLTLFDFGLQQLAQFQGIEGYDYAESHSQAVQAASSFLLAEPLLPGRDLSDEEVNALIVFLRTLSDDCVRDFGCRNQWTPTLDEDPDGNLLVAGVNPGVDPETPVDPDPDTGEPPVDPVDYPKAVALDFTAPPRATFAELASCNEEPSLLAVNSGLPVFLPRHLFAFGLYDLIGNPLHPHGFDQDTWNLDAVFSIEPVMIAGGVSAGYLDDDCWLDLAYAGGDASGMVFYRNRGGQLGFDSMDLLTDDPGRRFTGTALIDLNGDYRREMLFGNVRSQVLPIYSSNDDGDYYPVAKLPMSRNTYGMSFADANHDGYPDMFLAHWYFGNVLTAPVFWKNNAGQEVENYDSEAGLSNDSLQQAFNFSPQFADINADGELDLLLASDFGTSVVMEGQGNGTFANITDRDIITDENGMGSALGDYDNDGDLDWFVTSIFDPDGEAEANWGVTGNRLYRNNSVDGELLLENVTETAGVADGNWGWGACFADFNNDGFLDIFHVNGFGHIPASASDTETGQSMIENYQTVAQEYFDSLPRLFINQGDGSFSEQAVQWNLLLPSDGRGITCMDYDRDGDMDVALLDHSKGLQFFSNQIGNGSGKRFLSVRLVGQAPNTEAIGARVQVSADVGGSFGEQTQMRMANANTNFNGQNPPDLHFGMGSANSADLTVTWPNGVSWQCNGVNTNRFMILDQRSLPASCSAAP
ncbi:FG-GAP-like repeat-containing protein [Alcanivorax sp. S6407]|uniref:FG-GAP-like repeat-containing protein n=1 Tax=Alcanivorax sp. S6407 TaxID=2926424 RepID=UPI001FF64B71|nr:FG-GAP-like repeat-containing protein [Alcanivorax sp. S6407]MCK0153198.1 FG-GAP-like repeat-containing protein [Alcanivorax sp. S6407]